MRRGHKIAIPYGEDWDYDLIVCRDQRLERVQVKHTTSDGKVIRVRCRSYSLTNGRVRATKRYTAAAVDWVAVWDATTDCCDYVPSAVFDGDEILHLRLAPAVSGRQRGIRWARDYLDF